MSHTLARLRDVFGDPLLVRQGNQMLLTPRAEALAPRLREAFSALEVALREPDSFEPQHASVRFTIAASDAVTVTVVPRLLRLFATEAPRAEVCVVPYAREALHDALASGSWDVAIGPPLGEQRAALSTRTLYSTEFVVVMRQGHPKLRGRLDLDTYCALDHVVVGSGGRGRSLIDEALERKKRVRRIAARVPSFLAAPALVAETDLVLTSPRHPVEHAARNLPLELMTPPLSLPKPSIRMYWHRRFTQAAPQRWLRDALARAVRNL